MSREIKFRAWHKEAKVMLNQPYDGEYMSETTSLNSVIKGCQKHENQVLMQYTGLKDKNGVEIYEGDIVKIHKWPEEGTENRIVTYDAPSFWLAKTVQDRVDVDIFSTPGIHEEVIGNLYQNPELLEANNAQS